MPAPTLPTLTLSRAPGKSTDLLLVGLTEAGLVGVPEDLVKSYPKKVGTSLAELASSLGAKPKPGTTITVPALAGGPRLVVIGLASEPTAEDLRRAAGAGIRHASSLAGDEPLEISIALGADTVESVQAVGEGALIGSYSYAPISSTEASTKINEITVVSSLSTRRSSKSDPLKAAATVAQAVTTAREWVNIPPNLLYPESFAEEAKVWVKDSRVSIEVLDDKALTKGGYGGLLAVGGGSSRLPRLVRLSYAPRGAKTHIALVGKGITFDSGGLNLKPGDSMYTMKTDMAGAAAVLAATRAIADLGLKIKITAYAALAENLPSDTSYRPSDVLTMYGGKTVENGNTDAEGRLVMADALARSNADDPDLIVDIATLTGAAVVALGERVSAVMATDDETAGQLLQAAASAGESFWQLPIPDEFRDKLDSKVADLKSTGTDRSGGALTAAAFLREFVDDGTAWAHLDIAGPSYHTGTPYGYVNSGGTGVGVRTLISLAANLAS